MSHQALRSALDLVQPDHSLPGSFYSCPQIFASDVELIFNRHWLYVGLDIEVPEPGDYFTVEIGNNSIVIIRDDDENINAFHNSCCHRGARICLESSGSVGKLVCPYHQWVYEPSGKLIMARNMGKAFDVSGYALKPVHIRSVEGLLFICLAEQPPSDFETMVEEISPYLRPFQLRNAKIAHREDLIEEGNWKLTIENNRECYHCEGSHPELGNAFNHISVGFDPDSGDIEEYKQYCRRHEQSTVEWESRGYPSRAIEHMADRVSGFRIERVLVENEGESHTMDTKSACKKLLGNIDSPKLGDLHMWTNPNSWHHFLGDHAVTFSVLPLDANRSVLRTTWLVHRDAQEGVDYDLKNLTYVWQQTNAQDAHLVGITHKGARSVGYQPGPYSSASESEVILGTRWYLQRVRAGLE